MPSAREKQLGFQRHCSVSVLCKTHTPFLCLDFEQISFAKAPRVVSFLHLKSRSYNDTTPQMNSSKMAAPKGQFKSKA